MSLRLLFLRSFVFLVSFCCLSAKPIELAPQWTLPDGSHFRGTVSGVYGGLVVFDTVDSVHMLSVKQLSEASLEALADVVLSRPAVRPSWSKATEAVPSAVKAKLSILNGSKITRFAPPETRPTPDFYLVYFSAGWCPPCRRYTPELISSYRSLKERYGDKIELIFVSRDRRAIDQVEYVQNHGMPWPFVDFKQLGSVEVITRWLGPGIPCLIVVSPEGNILYHSYRGTEYLGPESVMARFEHLLTLAYGKAMNNEAEAQPLQAILKRRAAEASTKSPKP